MTYRCGRITYRGWTLSLTAKGYFIGMMIDGRFIRHSETPRTLQQSKDVIDEHLRDAIPAKA